MNEIKIPAPHVVDEHGVTRCEVCDEALTTSHGRYTYDPHDLLACLVQTVRRLREAHVTSNEELMRRIGLENP